LYNTILKHIFVVTNPTLVRLSTMRTKVGLCFLFGYMSYDKQPIYMYN